MRSCNNQYCDNKDEPNSRFYANFLHNFLRNWILLLMYLSDLAGSGIAIKKF
jgi:hypothetical protein